MDGDGTGQWSFREHPADWGDHVPTYGDEDVWAELEAWNPTAYDLELQALMNSYDYGEIPDLGFPEIQINSAETDLPDSVPPVEPASGVEAAKTPVVEHIEAMSVPLDTAVAAEQVAAPEKTSNTPPGEPVGSSTPPGLPLQATPVDDAPSAGPPPDLGNIIPQILPVSNEESGERVSKTIDEVSRTPAELANAHLQPITFSMPQSNTAGSTPQVISAFDIFSPGNTPSHGVPGKGMSLQKHMLFSPPNFSYLPSQRLSQERDKPYVNKGSQKARARIVPAEDVASAGVLAPATQQVPKKPSEKLQQTKETPVWAGSLRASQEQIDPSAKPSSERPSMARPKTPEQANYEFATFKEAPPGLTAEKMSTMLVSSEDPTFRAHSTPPDAEERAKQNSKNASEETPTPEKKTEASTGDKGKSPEKPADDPKTPEQPKPQQKRTFPGTPILSNLVMQETNIGEHVLTPTMNREISSHKRSRSASPKKNTTPVSRNRSPYQRNSCKKPTETIPVFDAPPNAPSELTVSFDKRVEDAMEYANNVMKAERLSMDAPAPQTPLQQKALEVCNLNLEELRDRCKANNLHCSGVKHERARRIISCEYQREHGDSPSSVNKKSSMLTHKSASPDKIDPTLMQSPPNQQQMADSPSPSKENVAGRDTEALTTAADASLDDEQATKVLQSPADTKRKPKQKRRGRPTGGSKLKTRIPVWSGTDSEAAGPSNSESHTVAVLVGGAPKPQTEIEATGSGTAKTTNVTEGVRTRGYSLRHPIIAPEASISSATVTERSTRKRTRASMNSLPDSLEVTQATANDETPNKRRSKKTKRASDPGVKSKKDASSIPVASARPRNSRESAAKKELATLPDCFTSPVKDTRGERKTRKSVDYTEEKINLRPKHIIDQP